MRGSTDPRDAGGVCSRCHATPNRKRTRDGRWQREQTPGRGIEGHPASRYNSSENRGTRVYPGEGGSMRHIPFLLFAFGLLGLVCTGGGYGGLAISYEGHDVARWLNTLGIAGIVLKYRVAPDRHPIPMYDAQRAIRFVRFYAKEWKVDPGRVGILGFSAG